jgi:hypothetical protein
MGRVLTIVMAVAATVLTAGAAAVAMGAVTGAASTFGAGLTALSGGLAGSGSLATAGTLAAGSVAASTGVGVATAGAAALGGAAGSIAGQGIGMALGNRESFSWREVAMSAVGSAIGSGVGQSGLGQLTFGLQGNGAGIASAMARSAITSSALQAVSLGAGSQGRFSWRAVTASAVGSGVGAGMGAAFGASAPPGGIGMTPAERFGELARGTVYGIAAGSAASAIGSGRVMARQVAVDAFGNALGNALGNSIAEVGRSAREALYSENIDREDAELGQAMRTYARDSQRWSIADQTFKSIIDQLAANPQGATVDPSYPPVAANGLTGQRPDMTINDARLFLPGGGKKFSQLEIDPATGQASFQYTSKLQAAREQATEAIPAGGTGSRFSVPQPVVDFINGQGAYAPTVRDNTTLGSALRDTGRGIINAGLGGVESLGNLLSGALPGAPDYVPFTEKLRAQYETPVFGNTVEVLTGIGAVRVLGSRLSRPSPIDASHLDELSANGVKFNRENVVATGRDSSGRVVFLETGNSSAGLSHIIARHSDDFAAVGIPDKRIADAVMRAATKGEVVGYQGVGTGRPIYEVVINGQRQHIAVTTSSNGFIVGANPRGIR